MKFIRLLRINITKTGFTLIELLVALTIVAILAVAVYAALNPAQRLKDAKDSRRATDVDTILTAVHQYIVDNKGTYPTGLSAGMVEKQLGTSTTGTPTCVLTSTSTPACAVAAATDCVNLTTPLAKYLKAMPIDPVGTTGGATAQTTKYSIKVDVNGIVTVNACNTDALETISASR